MLASVSCLCFPVGSNRHNRVLLNVGHLVGVKARVTPIGSHSFLDLLIGDLAIVQIPKVTKYRIRICRSVAFVLRYSPPILRFGHGRTKKRIDQCMSKRDVRVPRILLSRWRISTGRSFIGGSEAHLGGSFIGDGHIARAMDIRLRVQTLAVKKRIQTGTWRVNARRGVRRRRRSVVRRRSE